MCVFVCVCVYARTEALRARTKMDLHCLNSSQPKQIVLHTNPHHPTHEKGSLCLCVVLICAGGRGTNACAGQLTPGLGSER